MATRNATGHKLIAHAKRLARAVVKRSRPRPQNNASGESQLAEIKLAVIGSLAKGLARRIQKQIEGPPRLVAVKASLEGVVEVEKSRPTVVMIADVPQLRTSADINDYRARITRALEAFSEDRTRLVVWNSVPAACFAGAEDSVNPQ